MSKVLELCSDLPIKRVMEGEALMSQGGSRLEMAVLKAGKVEVAKDGQQIAVVDKKGSVFGEMSVILRSTHTSSVVALETSEFYMIEDPYSFLWERAEFNFELLNILATRLDEVEHELVELKNQSEAVSVVESMIEGISLRQPEK